MCIVIMAHPARFTAAQTLAELTGGTIVWDRRDDEWDTGARALAAHDPSTPWHVVLQDDAVPAPDFTAHLAAALEAAPRTVVGLYLGRGRPEHRQPEIQDAITRADRDGTAWFTARFLGQGVGIALPTEHITPLLTWARDRPEPYDQRIAAWYRNQGHPILITWPSLINHADGPSLVPHKYPTTETPRTAWRTITHHRDWRTNATPIRTAHS